MKRLEVPVQTGVRARESLVHDLEQAKAELTVLDQKLQDPNPVPPSQVLDWVNERRRVTARIQEMEEAIYAIQEAEKHPKGGGACSS